MSEPKPKRQTDEKSAAVHVTKKARIEELLLFQQIKGCILIKFWTKSLVDNTTEK
jgi:hypothetical protein